MSVKYQTYQIKGYCKANGYRRLEEILGQCATLYNAALQERRDAYRMARVSVSRIDQMKQFTLVRQDMPKWRNTDVAVGRGALVRVDRAFQSFFRRARNGQTPGFPRFRPRSRYRCIELSEVRPSMVKISADQRRAYVRIKGLPTTALRFKRKLPPTDRLKSLRINRRPSGIDVDLVYALPIEPPAGNEVQSAVGIDLGVNQRLTLSSGDVIHGAAVDRKREEELRRAVSRSQRGGNRRQKRVARLSRYTRKQHVKNRNACHRITTAIVRQYSHIAVEDLNIRNMTSSAAGTMERPGRQVAAKSGLNRSILEQTWGMLISQLRYKAEWAGGELVAVNPRYTSQTCSRCGIRRSAPLPDYRVFECSVCGYRLDRDHNVALNIEARAFGQEPRQQGGNVPCRYLASSDDYD